MDEVLRRLDADPDAAAVIAAAPVTDTIKEANISRRVLRTPERNRLWAVQTPQAFRSAGLREAVQRHPDDLGTVTDDAMLIEREGGEVLIHEAPAREPEGDDPVRPQGRPDAARRARPGRLVL